MPKASIVIPVYNTQEHVRACLDSVLAQTMADIEIICVNDGSTDGSLEIIREYAERDGRIVVVDQANRGLSGARNAGVKVATGEYLQFLDSDDLIDADTVSRLYDGASTDGLDVLYFNAQSFFEDDALESEHAKYASYYERSAQYPDVMTGTELLVEMALNEDYRPSACLQFIRRDFYIDSHLGFYEGILHEDNLFTFVCALSAKRVRYTSSDFYKRRIRHDSLVTIPKSFAHFKGFFVGYVEMTRFVMPLEIDERTAAAVAKLCAQMYYQALKTLCGLDKSEWDQIERIDTRPDALLACELLVRQGNAVRRNEKTKQELRQCRRSLKSLRNSRTVRAVVFLRRTLGFKK